MSKVKAKARARLEAACADPPECLAPVLPTIPDRLEVQIYADYRLFIFCASPSGAFL